MASTCLFAFLPGRDASRHMSGVIPTNGHCASHEALRKGAPESHCARQTYFRNGKKHDQDKHLDLCISHWTRRLKSDEV